MRPLKVLFLRSMSAGISYIRMWQFQQSMNRQRIADAAMPWFEFGDQNIAEWQFHVNDDPRVYARTGVIPSLVAGHKEFTDEKGKVHKAQAPADVVVVQYLHSWESLALIEALKACCPNTVFLTEIDDYVLDAPTANPAFMQYQPGWKYREIIVEQMKALDGIICSTKFLADAYQQFNKHTYVVPNGIDFNVWDKVQNREFKEVRIGWMGGDGHQEDLRSIEKPLKEFLKKHTNVFFYCVNGVPDFFKSHTRIVPVRQWFRIDKYPKALSKYGFDIGLAPLVDNNFTRGKSNLRKLEYAGLKIPVIAANVGPFKETCKHGKDGFLYSNDDEFTQALESLVFNKKLREAMGKYNNADVRKNFNVDLIAKDYVDILTEAHRMGQTTKVDVSTATERSGVSKWVANQPALVGA